MKTKKQSLWSSISISFALLLLVNIFSASASLSCFTKPLDSSEHGENNVAKQWKQLLLRSCKLLKEFRENIEINLKFKEKQILIL